MTTSGLPFTIPGISENPNPCEHLFWPFVDGREWVYGNATDAVTLTSAVSSSHLDLTLGSDTRSLLCLDGEFAGLLPGFWGSGHPDLGSNIQASNPKGSSLPEPALMLVGQTWEEQLDLTGEIQLSFIQSTPLTIVEGRRVTLFSARKNEDLTIEGAVFEVLPVDGDLFYELTVLVNGQSQSVLISLSTLTYFVEGLGPIRFEMQGGMVTSTLGSQSLEPVDPYILSAVIEK
jgi:hypothetical protein